MKYDSQGRLIVADYIGGSAKSQQWVFRRGGGVTIDGYTFSQPDLGAGFLSGDLLGPWTLQAPDWAHAALIDGTGVGGGGGDSDGTRAGGGGGSGEFILGHPVPIIPGETLQVFCPDGAAGNTTSDDWTEVSGALFYLALAPGERGGTPTGGRGGARYFGPGNIPFYVSGGPQQATSLGTASLFNSSFPPAAAAIQQPLGVLGAQGGSAGANSFASIGFLAGTTRGRISGNTGLGAGGMGGCTPFCRYPPERGNLAGANGMDALDVLPDINGYGSGGWGSGVKPGGKGGKSGPGLMIITFLEIYR